MDRRKVKTVPNAPEAERAILQSILTSEEAQHDVFDQLNGKEFYSAKNKLTFKAAQRIYNSGEGLDVVNIVEQLRETGDLEAVGGEEYISDLTASEQEFRNISDYCNRVKKSFIARELVDTGKAIVESAMDANYGDVDRVLDQAEKRIFDVAEHSSGGDVVAAKDLTGKLFEEIERRIEEDRTVYGLHTGFKRFDKMTGGLKPGQYMILAGRPSMGKSSLMLNIVMNSAIKHNKSICVFSLEMSEDEIMERMVASEGMIDSISLRSGELEEIDYKNLSNVCGMINQSNIYIDDSSSLTPIQLQSKARKLKRNKGLDLVVVDYLQLLHDPSGVQNRQNEVASISRSMKILAKDIGVPVIALSQLSRSPENRDDHKPILADLRASGGLEQDADIVAFVYRPSVYYGDTDADGNDITKLAELLVRKQRNGPTGEVKLDFHKKYMKFEEAEDYDDYRTR